jgi:sugar phosphate isomerase/epimerase
MLGALADELGVRILFENTFRLVDPIMRAFAASPSRNLGFLLDVGHANICGGVRELHAAMSADGRLVAMHVHDNSGVRDEHAPLGAGTVDLTGIALPRFVAIEVRDWQKAIATREDLKQRYL